MRNKTIDQEYLDFSMKSTLKVVQEYRAKYDGIGLTLEVNPKILDIAHGDISRVLSTSEYGRGGYTSEQILRSIIVMFIEEKELSRYRYFGREQRIFAKLHQAWE